MIDARSIFMEIVFEIYGKLFSTFNTVIFDTIYREELDTYEVNVKVKVDWGILKNKPKFIGSSKSWLREEIIQLYANNLINSEVQNFAEQIAAGVSDATE